MDKTTFYQVIYTVNGILTYTAVRAVSRQAALALVQRMKGIKLHNACVSIL